MDLTKNLKCIFGHKYCKCGWCIKHPICRRCYWDTNCKEYHPTLAEGMKCQHFFYELKPDGK